MTLPPPPPDAWGNVPEPEREPEPARRGRRGYTPSGPRNGGPPNALTDFYGERLAPNGAQLFAAILDGVLVFGYPTWYGYEQFYSVFRYSYEFPKGPWDHLAIVSWPLVIFIAVVNFGALLSVTGGSVGMWLRGLRACVVYNVPGPPSAGGGHYFCRPTLSQGLSYAFWHSLVDMLLFGIGHATTNRSRFAQTYGAQRAGFVVVENGFRLRLHQSTALGHKRVQVAPPNPVQGPMWPTR